ncbi:MAG TPA: 2Fe-2S iron-sulfur cluster binding domain-containing protein [Bacteroidetes bacterium]|nr:2Fe-2S iron-sulfur cluster binding domain-containing protein [Bacteroidota bacterium]
MISFILNNQTIQTSIPPGTTVLDFVRYHKHLVGTKIGCREGDCGACTVLVGEIKNGQLRYRSMTSCLMPLANAQGKHIVTIEGLNMEELSPVQQAIVEEGGTQCGFCTVGFVVSLTGFAMQGSDLLNLKDLVNLAVASIDGNICRCTGYKSLERAAEKIAGLLNFQSLVNLNTDGRLQWLVENKYLPHYFLEIKKRLEALSDNSFSKKQKNGNGTFVGGGTDLFVQKPEAMVDASIEAIFDKKELNKIYDKGGACYIGAAATATDIKESPFMQSIFPKLKQHIKLVSSTPIRNMGTLGGNLVNASPIGDLTIFFLALDSSIILNKNGNKRTLKLRHFYKAYKTLDKAPDEYIETIFFEIPDKKSHFNFEKICKRTHLDIASVNTACLLKMDGDIIREAHISAGGVGPIPKYLERSSAALKGQKINTGLIKKTAAIIQEEISPISDARGTEAYKRLLLRQLFFGHFLEMENSTLKLEKLV